MHIVQGDLQKSLELTLTLKGVAFPLIGGDVISLRWTRARPELGGTPAVVTPTVVNPPGTDGKINHDFVAGQTAVAGTYYGRVTVTRASKPITFPDDGTYFLWFVSP